MAYLGLKGSFAKMRLNVDASGVRHVGGSAEPSLSLGKDRHADQKWIASLRCSWELVATNEHYIPRELEDQVRERPEYAHSLTRLHGDLLGVFVTIDPRGFDHFWRVFGNHLGNNDMLMSISVPLDDYYPFLHPEQSVKADLLAGVTVVSAASLGVHSREFAPHLPSDA